jgi:hypothetical protein
MRFDLIPYMDASFPVFFDSVKIVTHYPKVDNRADALIAIYSKTVHLCSEKGGNFTFQNREMNLHFRIVVGVGPFRWFRSGHCHHLEILDRLTP